MKRASCPDEVRLPADLDANIDGTFIDLGISVDGALTAGDHILRLENQGAQLHVLDLMKAPDGITDDALGLFIMEDKRGPSATGVQRERFDTGGIDRSASDRGGPVGAGDARTGHLRRDVLVPDGGHRIAHAMNGMHAVFTVTG